MNTNYNFKFYQYKMLDIKSKLAPLTLRLDRYDLHNIPKKSFIDKKQSNGQT